MVKLANVLNRLNTTKILVVGDLLLDSYTIGKAKRISPEAPVAVVNVQQEEHRPGGAGNVILNLLSLGAQVSIVGRVGNDWAGDTLINALEKEGVETHMILRQQAYPTPVKNRIMADNQQIVRVDYERMEPLDHALEQEILKRLPVLLQDVQVVALSDYGKGFLTLHLLKALMQHAQQRRIPVITDPKGYDFKKYKGTTVIKPNLSEAIAAANLPFTASLEEVASSILQQTEAELLMITRSEAGISLFDNKKSRRDFPVRAKEVKDVTGAGDTVLAMLAHGIASQLSYEETAQLCNIAAEIAIEHVGCARVSLSDLALRLLDDHKGGKIFEQEHLLVLQEVLKQKSFNLLLLSQVDQLTHALFQLIKKIAGEAETLLVYLDHSALNEALIEMLASLQEVSFMIFHWESLKALCQFVTPIKTYAFECNQGQIRELDQLPCLLSTQ